MVIPVRRNFALIQGNTGELPIVVELLLKENISHRPSGHIMNNDCLCETDISSYSVESVAPASEAVFETLNTTSRNGSFIEKLATLQLRRALMVVKEVRRCRFLFSA
jgi:hypothetical protein